MIVYLLAMRDIKTDTHKPIFTVPNINAAIRDIKDALNEPGGKEDWQRHPEDFELWLIAETDTTDYLVNNCGGDSTPKRQLLALSTLKD